MGGFLSSHTHFKAHLSALLQFSIGLYSLDNFKASQGLFQGTLPMFDLLEYISLHSTQTTISNCHLD